MKHIIATALTATALLLAVEPANGAGRMGGTTGRGTPAVVAPQQTFMLSNRQAVIVARPFLFPFRHGFNRFGCCFGPGIVGSGFVGADVGDPYYPYPYPVYAAPTYQPAPADQPPSVAPPVFCYVGRCYHLQGDGVSVPYQWAWVPAVPASPPGLPPAAPRI